MAWFKSISDLSNNLIQKGGKLSMQIDVTATQKNLMVQFLFKRFLITH